MLLALSNGTVLFWAGIGGIAVFAGLLLEKVAEIKKEKYSPPFFNPLHWLSTVGWLLLMAGIAWEIGDALVTAHEIRKAQQMADWINQPIFAFEGHAKMFVKPLERIEGLENLPSLPIASLWSKVRLPNEGNEKPVFLVLGRSLDLAAAIWRWKEIDVNSDNVTRSLVLEPSGKRLALCFDIYFDRNSSTLSNGSLMPDELDAIRLTLPIRCEVLGGEMRMELDGRTNRVFNIPPQTTFVKCVSSVATNGTFAPIDFSPKVRAQNPFPPPDTNTDFLYLHN